MNMFNKNDYEKYHENQQKYHANPCWLFERKILIDEKGFCEIEPKDFYYYAKSSY
jgi:hypothetical protein